MSKLRSRAVVSATTGALITALAPLASAAAPSGPHPRLWLDGATQSGLRAQASDPGSAVTRGAARCSAARNDPGSYAQGGWQGFEFVLTLSGCLASWAATDSADDLATAIKYWTVLLDDYQTVGDGAGGDAVVTHDTGYAMRTFAPYSAIAYDWLHDAPGVSSSLLSHARARFDAWVTYYTGSGYLRDLAGANYEAGYAFAATLIAIAEAGEAGAAGDAHWATVADKIWGQDLVPAFATGGVLEGGDWPEGWQYGPLSVTELGLAARAMQDNGTSIPGAGAWADSLVLRFANDLTPVAKTVYAAGDSDNDTPNRAPDNGPLVAALAGPAGAEARAWARELNDGLGLVNENALFDALAAARGDTAQPLPADLPTNYLGSGAGNWYVRGAWSASTTFGVFQCTRRLVDDHEHNDAGNWVLTRGADDLIVDPSPYGTLSTLTGNAPAVDSNAVPSGYSPSQGYWGQSTRLVWARQSTSGVAVARCDYGDQFRADGVPSDVASALRDFVLVPDGGSGEVVLIDRAVTGDGARGLHLRVRTPGTLALTGGSASADVGASSLTIERVWSSSGTPSVREMPQASECDSGDHACDVSRLPAGSEYRVDVAGPEAMALHVVTARAAGATVSTHTALSGDGYRGVVVPRAGSPVVVIASDTTDGNPGATFSYLAPANALHIVVDAPASSAGKSDVRATPSGTDCAVEVTAHAASSGGYDGAPLIVRLDADCAVTDDGTQQPPDPMNPPPGDAGGAAGEGPGAPAGASGAGDDTGQPVGSAGRGAASGGTSGVGGSGVGGSSAGEPTVNAGGTGALGAAGSAGLGSPGVPSSAGTGGPTTPMLSTCSVAPNGRDGGPGGALMSALLGLTLLRTKRRGRLARR